jgi:hypothetical protein
MQSGRLLILSIMLLIGGCIELIMGWSDHDAAKRETTAAGTVTRVYHGKGTTYYYSFKVDGVEIADSASECRTALTSLGCIQGAGVLVYYDKENPSNSKLQEFSIAGTGQMFWGLSLAAASALLFFLSKRTNDGDQSDGLIEDRNNDSPEDLHITPGN